MAGPGPARLAGAKLLIAGEANAEALFHCQQAVEKALKAFLTFHEGTFRKTHDLGDLSPECLAIDASLQPAICTSPFTRRASSTPTTRKRSSTCWRGYAAGDGRSSCTPTPFITSRSGGAKRVFWRCRAISPWLSLKHFENY